MKNQHTKALEEIYASVIEALDDDQWQQCTLLLADIAGRCAKVLEPTQEETPDLLAALRAMVATFHRTGTSEKMNAYITAKEVIAKAEGGEE